MGDYDKAIESYKNSLQSNPENPKILENMGKIYAYFKDFKNAIKYFKESLKYVQRSPEKMKILRKIGDNYSNIHQYDKAKRFYKKALKIEPENADIFISFVKANKLEDNLLSNNNFIDVNHV